MKYFMKFHKFGFGREVGPLKMMINHRQTDRRTDRQAGRQTEDRRTDIPGDRD
jgi:hypothetical protein